MRSRRRDTARATAPTTRVPAQPDHRRTARRLRETARARRADLARAPARRDECHVAPPRARQLPARVHATTAQAGEEIRIDPDRFFELTHRLVVVLRERACETSRYVSLGESRRQLQRHAARLIGLGEAISSCSEPFVEARVHRSETRPGRTIASVELDGTHKHLSASFQPLAHHASEMLAPLHVSSRVPANGHHSLA